MAVKKKPTKKSAVEKAVDLELEEVVEDEETEDDVDVESIALDLAEEEDDVVVDVADVIVASEDDSKQAVSVIVIADVPRFFMSTTWVEPMKKDTKVKLPKHVAEHLQERGKVKIV